MKSRSDKLVIIRDFRREKGMKEAIGMCIITASIGRDDEEMEKYAIYNKKWIDIYSFAMGVEGKTSISLELYDSAIMG